MNKNKIAEEKPIELRFQRFTLNKLADMIPDYKGGKNLELRVMIKNTLKKTPIGQFGTLTANDGLAKDQKKRNALMQSVKKMLKKMGGWIMRYNSERKIFLLVREADWNKMSKENA